MRPYFLILCFAILAQRLLAQSNTSLYLNYDYSLQLEEKSDTTANASFGDFDGDGHLDILLVKGRHWPIVDRVLLGDGSGGIRKAYNLGTIADRSYTGGVTDFNGDGHPDIAISNDKPDRKLIYLNDGKGNFTIGSAFGLPEWPTRNLSIADINNDKLPDLILANRGNAAMSNYICVNQGKGEFQSSCTAFARYPATTITPADFNKDGKVDLVVPHRNGGQSYMYLGSQEGLFSDERRIPFGPKDATIRGAGVADFNGDRLLDIVAIDERKGVTIYLGQKDQTFLEGISLADATAAPYALAIADLNNDEKMDVIVGHIEAPSTVYLNSGKGPSFESLSFGDSAGTVYGFAVGDFNEDGTPDIAAARSDAPNILYFGKIKAKK